MELQGKVVNFMHYDAGEKFIDCFSRKLKMHLISYHHVYVLCRKEKFKNKKFNQNSFKDGIYYLINRYNLMKTETETVPFIFEYSKKCDFYISEDKSKSVSERRIKASFVIINKDNDSTELKVKFNKRLFDIESFGDVNYLEKIRFRTTGGE